MYGELSSSPVRGIEYKQIKSGHVNIWQFINKYLPKASGVHPESGRYCQTDAYPLYKPI